MYFSENFSAIVSRIDFTRTVPRSKLQIYDLFETWTQNIIIVYNIKHIHSYVIIYLYVIIFIYISVVFLYL